VTLNLNKIEREEIFFPAFSCKSGYLTTDELQQDALISTWGYMCVEDLICEVEQDNDARIDYNEFVTMMCKGNGDIGRSTCHSNLSWGFSDALMST
jgi:calcium-dependent protein kinase